MKTQSFISRVAATTGLMVGAFALAAVASWSAPANPPPSCPTGTPGCDAPINVSATEQAKEGRLGVGETSLRGGAANLDVVGSALIDNIVTNTITLVSGAGAGKILTSDASGLASWADPSAATTWSASDNYVVRRGPIVTVDSVAWCPTTNPYIVSCSAVDDEAADTTASGIPFTSLDNPCKYSSFGIQTRNVDGTCPDMTMSDLGSDFIYTQRVKKTTANEWGCMTYDLAATHKPYRAELVCSK